MMITTEQNPVAKKLRIKSGHKVLILQAPAGYPEKLSLLESETLVTDQTEAGKADLLLLFAENKTALQQVLPVLPLVKKDALLWIAYPKGSSKLKSDLNRDILYSIVKETRLEGVALVALDETWSAMRFKPADAVESKRMPASASGSKELVMPEDFADALAQQPEVKQVFDNFAYTHRKEYINWITEAKKAETRSNRITKALEMLKAGKKSR